MKAILFINFRHASFIIDATGWVEIKHRHCIWCGPSNRIHSHKWCSKRYFLCVLTITILLVCIARLSVGLGIIHETLYIIFICCIRTICCSIMTYGCGMVLSLSMNYLAAAILLSWISFSSLNLDDDKWLICLRAFVERESFLARYGTMEIVSTVYLKCLAISNSQINTLCVDDGCGADPNSNGTFSWFYFCKSVIISMKGR